MNDKMRHQRPEPVSPLRPWMTYVADFVAAETLPERWGEVRSSDFYAAFGAWSALQGDPLLSQRRVALAMKALGYKLHKRSVMYWHGLVMRPADAPAESDAPVNPAEF